MSGFAKTSGSFALLALQQGVAFELMLALIVVTTLLSLTLLA